MTNTSKTTQNSGKLPIVFFGSGPVAAASLRLLLEEFAVEAVITKPHPAHHKGKTPVLELCKERAIQVFTPSTKKELSALFEKKPVKSKIGVVIDYGIIISQDVIDYFPFGIVNSHFSLLPQWRGADPITFSVLSGQELTGVSLMVITAGMDEGPLLSQSPYILPKDVTTPTLTTDLIEVSHASLKTILPLYIRGEVVPREQDPSLPTSYSRKLTKADGTIDWQKPAEVIEREIRAFIEWPKSTASLLGKDIVLTKAKVSNRKLNPGEMVSENKQLFIGCGKDSLEIESLKPAGKKEMTAAAFLAGYGHLLKR